MGAIGKGLIALIAELLKSFILGLVQGITEFLPVSSSGHLAILETFAGIESNVILLNVLLHTGTLGAICFYYRNDLKHIAVTGLRAVRKGRSAPGVRSAAAADRKHVSLIAKILIADAVTVIVALFLYKPTETISLQSGTIGWFLVLTAVMLILTRFVYSRGRQLDWKDALMVGFFQGIAVLPGISRSGATIFAALLLGADRREAVRFSFLIAVPVLLGATVFEAAKGIDEIRSHMLLYLPGTVISFAAGWFCLRLLETITVRKHLHWFAVYLVPAGITLAFI